MKRTGFKPRAQTLSQRAKLKKVRAVNPLKAGKTGARLVPKDEAPIYSDKHLDLVSGAVGVVAHHARGLLPRTMGKRITDFLAVPLRPDLHDGFGHSLHRHGNEMEWWHYTGVPQAKVFAWIRHFLLEHYAIDHPGVVQAFVKMDEEEAKA